MELKKIHRDCAAIPLISRISVLTSVNGMLDKIIGRTQINNSIKFGKVMRYAAFGPERSDFEEELNRNLFCQFVISQKEKDALSLVAKGYAFKEIANSFKVSASAIEKRILPLYKRFDVRAWRT